MIRKNTYVFKILCLYICKQTGYAVAIGLTADDAHIRVRSGLRREMLAGAKPNFKPQGATRGLREEEKRRAQLALVGQGEVEAWQKRLKKSAAPSAQPRTAAPTVHDTMAALWPFALPRQANADASELAKSTRSQENPPSGSGARPKWPYAAVRA